MYLRRNSKFGKPVIENGIHHRFSFLVGDRSDHSVLSESVCDAKDKFFITGQKGRHESGGLDSPELGVALAEFVCWLISSFAGTVGRSFGASQCLVSSLAKNRRWRF